MNAAPDPPPPRLVQSRLGGGGYVTGLVFDPRQRGRLWARCDVAGVFLSDDGGRSWQPRNAGLTDCSQHSVESLALSPHDSRVLFRCSGEARGGRSFGFIHGSWDAGATWQLVSTEPDYLGNGDVRDQGEMIAVDPFDASCVAAASISRGVFVSRDGGRAWSASGLAGEPLKALAFHPRVPGLLYAGTLTAPPHAASLHPHGVTRPPVGRLHLSRDQGRTWELLAEGLHLAFLEIQFCPANDATLYACAGALGLWRSTDGGRTFARLATDLPLARANSLAIDPRDARVLYLADRAAPWARHREAPVIPLHVSRDGGATWRPLHDYTPSDFSGYPYPPGDIRPIGWAIAKIRLDPFDSASLAMSNWFGVSVSHDGGRRWCGHDYAGLENICLEAVAAHPTHPEFVAFTAADKPLCVSRDGGRTFRRIAQPYRPANYFCTTALAFSRADPRLVLYGAANQTTRAAALYRSDDASVSSACVHEFAPGHFVQSLIEDPAADGTFWASVDGPLAAEAGLWRTGDFGRTWTRLPGGGLPVALTQLPHDREWIENELLSVVWYQTKNACGSNQLLAPQPGRPGAFYWGEWTRGLWRTDDAGRTWHDLSPGLPFGAPRPTTLVSLATDPAHPARLYAGFIAAGLWRSDDRGATWRKLFPLDAAAPGNASALAAHGADVFVASEPLAWSPGRPALWHSADGGRTWRDLHDPALGALRYKSLAWSPATRTLHAATCGNGAFHLQLPPS